MQCLISDLVTMEDPFDMVSYRIRMRSSGNWNIRFPFRMSSVNSGLKTVHAVDRSVAY
uniref:Uncharacterized protein n=1 Tax=Arundo donax TaxID=35708 RepID=A0A0A9CQR5_ARUDO